MTLNKWVDDRVQVAWPLVEVVCRLIPIVLDLGSCLALLPTTLTAASTPSPQALIAEWSAVADMSPTIDPLIEMPS